MTSYRIAFKSKYLASDDLYGPIDVTVSSVNLEPDQTNRSKENILVARFAEREIRPGEPLKPMMLNVGHCKMLKKFSGSKDFEDWKNIRIRIYVQSGVKLKGELVDGLRIHPDQPKLEKPELTPENKAVWSRAVDAYKKTKTLDAVKKTFRLSKANETLIIKEAQGDA